MDNFHRLLVAGLAVTATRASVILNVNRDKKREVSLSVSSKHSIYRPDRMAAQIVADIISKENTKKQVSFADEQVDTMKDVSMPQTFLSKNRHFRTTAVDLIKIWGIIIFQAALSLNAITQKLNRSALIILAQR